MNSAEWIYSLGWNEGKWEGIDEGYKDGTSAIARLAITLIKGGVEQERILAILESFAPKEQE